LRKIGIYGGTFDPIHHAHLILARGAREQFELESVIFVPAGGSPFKELPVADREARLAMLQSAIAGEPGFSVDEFELHRPPPSFTIHTVEHIRERETNAELYYLIGEDNLAALTKWHRFEDLQNLVRFVILDRTGAEGTHSYPTVRRKIDISATEIRKRVASQRSIRYFVPDAVEKIIHRQRLYQEK
jgi:nicotinate-nucleotide adenylyltransferase